MKIRIKIGILSLFMACSSFVLAAGELKMAKLRNGLTVYVWEDTSKPDVYGSVICKVGSVDEPIDLTGMAHYLEHLMFKGTETISSLDWEKEKPVYQQIIAKYDELAKQTDPEQRKTLTQEINTLTIQAAQYTCGNEFSAIIEKMGGKGLNAATSYDFTMYHNSFPSNHLQKWLEVYSERMVHPVFRTFQTELETVYEEYNRSMDNRMVRFRDFLFHDLYGDNHPYGHSVLGLSEHLKNPQLSRLIEFYNTWYVPENMALVLVGNVKFEEAFPMIKESFSKLVKKPVPARASYQAKKITKRAEVSAKLLPYPMLVLGFNGVSAADSNRIGLDIMGQILTNPSQTGLLDKYTLDGDLNGTSFQVDARRDLGRLVFTGVPRYDNNQRLWASHKSVENLFLKEVENLKKGNFEDWVFASIKQSMIHDAFREQETNEGRLYGLLDCFIYEKDVRHLLNYADEVNAITKEQVVALANQYLTANYEVIKVQEGKLPAATKLEKPQVKPVETNTEKKSAYAEWVNGMEEKAPAITFCDFNQVQTAQINAKSKLFYTKNPENDIFTLTLKYGIGTRDMRDLDKAVSLMGSAGVMGQMKPIEFKQAMSRLNARCTYTVDDDYLTISMEGNEANLQEACLLLSRQILMPALDEHQVEQVTGLEYQQRKSQEDEMDAQERALIEYVLYGDRSEFVDRTPLEKIYQYSISDYTGKFQHATDYAAEIHYVGSMPFDQVKNILSANLPLKASEKDSQSPQDKVRQDQTETTIYFYPNTDAKQSKIYFLLNGRPFTKEDLLPVSAFNSYFSRLVYTEIREKRSMAYESWGILQIPKLPNDPLLFVAFVGTQGDKTLDAIDVITNLMKQLPVETERMNSVKMNLKESLATQKPLFRNASQTFEQWKRLGFTEDPAKVEQPQIDALTFETIQKVYNENIKDKPYAIAIVGNPRSFDVKALEKYGKVVRVSTRKLFAEKAD